MKKIKNISFILIIIMVLITPFFLNRKSNAIANNENIDLVLENKYYSYLPLEAKEYIKDIYRETGEIILTEKNKKEDKPYLNPEYVEYLENSYQYDIIPEPTIIDFNMKIANVNNNEYPSFYNLWDVDGNSYVAPSRNQGSLGLCWDFATTSQIESFLLVNNNTPYTTSAKMFSERQVDYATSNNGILEGNDFYNYRKLGDAGTFEMYLQPALDGLALVDASFNGGTSNYYSVDKMEAKNVFRHDDSQYEVNSSVTYPHADLNSISEDKRTAYLNGLKNAIVNYGGIVVSFSDTSTNCSIEYKSSRLIYNDNKCYAMSHAMHIIGWDDNAEYSLCTKVKSGNTYSISADISNCPSENIVHGKGTWLVKNSYGSDKIYYIAYDTHGTPSYNYVTELTESTWDNNNLSYDISSELQEITINDTARKVIANRFTKKNSGKERIDKIKYQESSQNRTYNIYLDDGEGLKYLETLNTTYSGNYVLDLSDKNVYVNNDTFILYFDVDLPSGELEKQLNTFSGNRTRIYTSNVDNDIKIKTYDSIYEDDKIANENKYKLFVKSDTKNLSEGTIIDYKILDNNGEEIEFNYNYFNNEVFINHVYSSIEIDGNLPKGEYILQTIYNNNVYSTSKIKIDKELIYMSGGNGTLDDPYLIENSEQLSLIKVDQSAYYKLIDDIDLTYDTQNPNGKYYNEGKGWEPIVYDNNDWNYFYGGLDGGGHTIKGLFINRPEDNFVGLFSRLSPHDLKLLQIKNLNFENVNIKGGSYVGALAGQSDAINYTNCVELSNISVLNGKISGDYRVGGITGDLYGGSDMQGYCNAGGKRQIFNGFYNGATITGNNLIGGLFGYVSQFIPSYNYSTLEISNIQNIGDVNSSNTAGGLFGGLKIFNGKTTVINNAINIGNVSGNNCSNDLSCNVNSQNTSGILSLNNIYFKKEGDLTASDITINYNNVSKHSITDLKNIDIYSNWESFDDNWIIQKVDDIDRIPILKFVPFVYTSIDNINVNYGEQQNLYDYINPKIDKAKDVQYKIEDTTIATIDEEGNINGIKKGTTNIHIVSNYDGYDNNIILNVINNSVLTINYDSNGGTGTMEPNFVENGTTGKISINSFIRTGYKFKSWNTKSDGTGTSYSAYDEIINDQAEDYSMTLYAIWEPINHTIVYHANNGTTDESIQIALDSIDTQLNKNKFTYDGYIFVNWNTESDGSGDTYTDEQLVSLSDDLTLYAQWEKEFDYEINNYDVDEENKYIKGIEVNTEVNNFTPNITLGYGYGIDVDSTEINGKNVLYTGGKTKINKGIEPYREYTNVVLGDTNGDGKITYVDYVKVYNHIQKERHPELDKNLLTGAYLIAGDMSKDNKISYLDYVKIYNKIKELKETSN